MWAFGVGLAQQILFVFCSSTLFSVSFLHSNSSLNFPLHVCFSFLISNLLRAGNTGNMFRSISPKKIVTPLYGRTSRRSINERIRALIAAFLVSMLIYYYMIGDFPFRSTCDFTARDLWQMRVDAGNSTLGVCFLFSSASIYPSTTRLT